MLAQDCAAVLLGRALAGDGGARRIALCDDARHTAGGVFRGDAMNLWIRRQETPALFEGDWMRLDRRDCLERCARAANQIMIDRNDDFS